MASNDQYDILISNISKMYGSAATTREKLKQFLISEFMENNWIFKYGRLHSIRLPYSQDPNTESYFGFLTMADYAVHDTVIKEMQAKKWLFGDLFLQFDKSSTVRIPFSKQVNSNDERQEPKRYKRRISEEDVIEIHDTRAK